MAAAAMKYMASNFPKLDKFEGVDFKRWQKKMHFLLSSMSVVYVLTAPMSDDGGDNPTVEQVRKRAKWDNNDYICKGLILNGMSDPLFDIYHNDFKHTLKHKKEGLTLVELGSHLRIKESLRVQDSDKPKSNNVAGPSVVNMLNIDNDNIGPVFMSTSKLNDSILWHVRLGHVHFKRMQDMSKDGLIPAFDMDNKKCKTCMLNKITKKPFQNVKREIEALELIHSDLCDLHATPSLGNKKYFVTFIDDASRFCYVYLLHSKDEALGQFKVFKTKVKLQQGSPIKRFRTDRGVVRLPEPKLKTLGERECIFVGYDEHSKAFRFYVIEPNDSISINSIIESRDAIFDENNFFSVPRSSLRIPNGTEDIGGSVIPEEVTEEVVQQSEPELRKSKKNRTLKNYGLEFQLYLIEGTKDEDVAFWKEAINDEMDSIMGNNTWVLLIYLQGFKQKSKIDYFNTYALVARINTIRLLIAMTSIHNLIIHQMDVKTTFLNGELEKEVYMNQPQGFIMPGNKNKVDLTNEFLSLRFSMKNIGETDVNLSIRIKHESNGIEISQSHYIEKVLKKFNYSECTLVITPMDISEKLMPNNGQTVSQLEYSRVIGGFLMYAMTYNRPDIAFDVGKLSRYTSNPGTQHWQAIQRASKKQTCITGSIIESEFVALAAAGKEAKWLKNLLLEIPLWVKPIAPISILYDSVFTLAKAYSQMYNEKSKHLDVRHSMIRELITNGGSMEFGSYNIYESDMDTWLV
ncbi:zinc finger, CCHC-type containing protein [Tanacetum coccineum]